MLVTVNSHTISALRSAIGVLRHLDEGTLVEIKTQAGRVVVIQITGPDGRVPEMVDEAFVYAVDL